MADVTVLVITALEDVTADMVIEKLGSRARVVRLDPADIGTALRFDATINPSTGGRWSGTLHTASRTVELCDVRAVYHRRPSPWTFEHLDEPDRAFAAAEARYGLGGLLANIPGALYVNHATARAEYKVSQLRVADRVGLQIPPTLVTNDVEAARKFAAEHGPVVYKAQRGVPVTPEGLAGAIWVQRVDPATFDDSISVTAHLFQKEVLKTGDARVTAVGTRLFAQRITTPDRALDWRSGS
jgi:hypothetical protein